MNRATIILLFIFSLGFAECTPKRNIAKVKSNEELVAADVMSLNKQLKEHTPGYKWIISQGDLSYDDGTSNVTANISMRNRQDSIIWTSANVLIEALRILVNKDSAIVMNRMQKNYNVFPVSDLNKMFGINNLDLNAVQNILRALPPFELEAKSKFEVKDGTYQIENLQPTYKEDITIDRNILRMTQYRYERNASEYVLVKYSDFKKTGDQLLPNKIDMEVYSPDKIHIILNVSDYSLQDTDDAPFYIPQSYSKVK